MSGSINATLILISLLTIGIFAEENNSPVQSNCVDTDSKCALWASQGECQSNAVWMMSNCRRSCQSCQGGDRAWQLRNHLSKNYDNTTSNATKPVRIESLRISHMEIEEERELVRLNGRMVLSWNDSKVAWDKDTWGVSWLNFYWIQVWTPQLLQINAPSSSPGVINGKVLAANYTGQVFMWTDFAFVAPYHFEHGNYPNDYQKICYKFDDKRYFSVRFLVSDDVRNRRHEAIAEARVSGWRIENVDLTDSKYVVQILGDWKQNPFDIETNNCELCVGLRRNAVYYYTEMLCPALATSAITLSAVIFQLSTLQPAVLAFSLSAQIMSMQLLNTRLPSFMNNTPTILKFSAFNLLATTLLFLASLALRRFLQTNASIPLPRSIYVTLAVVDKILPVPKGSKDSAEEVASGNYSEVALSLNNFLFSIFFVIYIFVIIFSFVF